MKSVVIFQKCVLKEKKEKKVVVKKAQVFQRVLMISNHLEIYCCDFMFKRFQVQEIFIRKG